MVITVVNHCNANGICKTNDYNSTADLKTLLEAAAVCNQVGNGATENGEVVKMINVMSMVRTVCMYVMYTYMYNMYIHGIVCMVMRRMMMVRKVRMPYVERASLRMSIRSLSKSGKRMSWCNH